MYFGGCRFSLRGPVPWVYELPLCHSEPLRHGGLLKDSQQISERWSDVRLGYCSDRSQFDQSPWWDGKGVKICRQQNDFGTRVAKAGSLHELKAVHFRHYQIGNNQIDGAFVQNLERVFAV